MTLRSSLRATRSLLRCFSKHEGHQTAISSEVSGRAEAQKIALYRYVDGVLTLVPELTLAKRENIEDYVIKTIKNYFRTTNKDELTFESKLSDHGLDSLDSVEVAMQIEEDLQYKISSENLMLFNKVKHYVNFIEQVESFKRDYSRDPLP